ncbi:MAG: DALR domain-containing protein, partial [Terriglobia bacterium]
PGWHLECSAMAMKYLGETFDIHSGGVDLIFPHHENEIAQSEGATGKPFARFWLHAEHLIVNGEKMSKSLGNFYTLRDLVAQGHRPSAIRYLLASTPFHRPMNFTLDGLHQAEKSIERLRNFRFRLASEHLHEDAGGDVDARAGEATRSFEAALDNNLNTAEALAAIFGLVSEANTALDRGQLREASRQQCLDALNRWDQIFAVLEDQDDSKLARHGLAAGSEAGKGAVQSQLQPQAPGRNGSLVTLSDDEIERQISLRNAARRQGSYADSDRIRESLSKAGIVLEDTKSGTRWRRG